jgi:spore coat protein CotH
MRMRTSSSLTLPFALVILSAAASFGCSDDPPNAPGGCGDAGTDADTDADTDVDSDSDADTDADSGVEDPLAAFFSLDAVHEIEIEVDETGVAALIADPYTYVHGAVRVDDAYYEDVGVRLKGAWGSFVPIDADYQVGNGAPGKSGFIIKFNEYVTGQKHLGLAKLTINNNVQDSSYIHQYVGYALFRELGVPASRAGFARVSFNEAEKGVYTLVEATDNHTFLDRWYGNHDGNLYEGEYGVDLNADGVGAYDQDNGDDTSRADLADLVAALDAVPVGADPLPTLDARFDFDEYLQFAAAELYMGHWDGYAWWINNYFVHHDLETDVWTFVPWGIDQTFGDPLGAYDGVMQAPGPGWGIGAGFGDARIQMLCFGAAACLTRLHDAFVEVLDTADAMDLRGLAEETFAAISDAALAETSEWGDPAATIYAAADTSAFIVRRREQMETWLPCLVGGAVDNDGDTHDGCTADCDDGNAAIHPGAPEACNGVDDDCNGAVDDNPECPRCDDATGPDGRAYSICSYILSWGDAESFCEGRNQRLAAVHDAETMGFLSGALWDGMEMDQAWIGLNDLASEGALVWADGSAVDFTDWAAGEPGAGGEYTDCVRDGPDGWIDVPCDEGHAFLCKSIPDCPPGEVWDPAADACEPWECTVEDLGAFAGDPIYAEGDTCVGTSIFADGDTNCTDWTAAERELLYSLAVPDGAGITVTMTPTGVGYVDASLYLLTDCLDFGRTGCVAGSDVSYGGGPETVAWTNDTGADLDVFIVADAYEGCGGFQLSVI